MSEELHLKLPKCASCGRLITPSENFVRFPCPNCGKTLIWRCEKCRIFVREYVCPNCGFKGP